MMSRVTALVVTLLVLFLLIFTSFKLGARPTDLHSFQLESKLIYIILNSLALGALVMFVLISYFPPGLPSKTLKKSGDERRDFVRDAETLFQLGDFEKSEMLLKEISTDEPGYWYAKKISGDIAFHREEFVAAESNYQESLKFAAGPDRALPLLGLAILYDHQHQSEQALDFYREIVKIQPRSMEAFLRLRLHAIKEQEWAEALSWQESIEGHFPKSIQTVEETQVRIGIRFELARSQFQKEAYKTAQALLKYILRLTDSFVPAYLLLGEIHLKLEHSSAALRLWEAGFAATESPVLLQRIAECFLAQGSPEAAIESLRSAIRNKPDNLALQFCLADLYLKMEMLAEAQSVLENITKKDPDWLLNQATLAELYLRTGQLEKASMTFKKMLAGESIGLRPWLCYNCSTTYADYHSLCLECMAWNSIELNQQKAGRMSSTYRESTASYD